MKTLIILDWDDTLFPTSWAIRNNLNLQLRENREKYLPLFTNLDLLLSRFLTRCMRYGRVVIVTNALPCWIRDSSAVLPRTAKILPSLRVISARELYQAEYPDMMEWKKHTFREQVMGESHEKVLNIVSVGDADYEYRALVNLYNWRRKNKKILKAIKLLPSPTRSTLVDQLQVLHRAIPEICEREDHLDWTFKAI